MASQPGQRGTNLPQVSRSGPATPRVGISTVESETTTTGIWESRPIGGSQGLGKLGMLTHDNHPVHWISSIVMWEEARWRDVDHPPTTPKSSLSYCAAASPEAAVEVRVRVDSFPRCSGAILEDDFLYFSGASRPQRHGHCISMTSNHACALNLAPNPPVISFAWFNTKASNQHVRSKM